MLFRDAIQARLQPVLDEFAQELGRAIPARVQTGSSYNDAFILRAFVEGTCVDDTAIALTVDVQNCDGVITVESCICGEDGTIFKEGPELRVNVDSEQQVLASFEQWTTQLHEYLRANRQYFIAMMS